MKKTIITIILFIIGFVGCYAFLCIHYETEMMWLLEISARQKLLAYISYKAPIKAVISLIAGIILCTIPLIIHHRK